VFSSVGVASAATYTFYDLGGHWRQLELAYAINTVGSSDVVAGRYYPSTRTSAGRNTQVGRQTLNEPQQSAIRSDLEQAVDDLAAYNLLKTEVTREKSLGVTGRATRWQTLIDKTRRGYPVKRALPLILLLLLLPSCLAQEQPQAPPTAQALPPSRSISRRKAAAPRRASRNRRRQDNDPRPSLQLYVRAYSQSPGRCPHSRRCVQVILDKSQRSEKYSSADFVPCTRASRRLSDAKHAIAHNKIMVIDAATVLTGSFNFHPERRGEQRRKSARDPGQGNAAKYTDNWKAHLEHSEKYEGKEQGYSETHRTDPAPKAGDAVTTGYVARGTLGVFQQGGLQRARKDFGEEPGSICEQGRGDCGGGRAVS